MKQWILIIALIVMSMLLIFVSYSASERRITFIDSSAEDVPWEVTAAYLYKLFEEEPNGETVGETLSILVDNAVRSVPEARKLLDELLAGDSWRNEQPWDRIFEALEKGDPAGLFLLGEWTVRGINMPENHRRGVRLVACAAKEGHVEAEYFLGMCYKSGLGVKEDQGEAVNWLRRAADKGHTEAEVNLGINLLLGEGAPPDGRRAMRYIFSAAAKGNPDARKLVKLFFQDRNVFRVTKKIAGNF